MKCVIRSLFPKSLRNRILLIFILFILLPFATMQIYYYKNTETVIHTNIVAQNYQYLEFLKNELEQIKVNVLQSLLILESDAELRSMLENPADFGEDVRGELFLEKTRKVTQTIGKPMNIFHFALYDMRGNRYSTFPSDVLARHDATIASKPWYERSFEFPYLWVLESTDQTQLKPESAGYISLYTLLQNSERQTVGIARFGFPITQWLSEIDTSLPVKQAYYLLDEKGTLIAQSKNAPTLLPHQVANSLGHKGERTYSIDTDTSRIISSVYMKMYGWTLVTSFDTLRYFGDIQSISKQFLTVTVVLTSCFILLTYFFSLLVTRPLRNLQLKMESAVRNDMRVHISENTNSAEVLQLTRAFNHMIDDTRLLIEQLKLEERRKEALRFQMLLSQMDPHFLLNTLNTIKWIALDYKVNPLADICTNLGTLLENSLVGDIELIHLHREIELMRAFVSIQQMRFGNRLQFEVHVPDELKYALAPKFSLQPLVENAIRHGFSEVLQTGRIQICAYTNQDELMLKVSDNGSGFQSSSAQGSTRKGIGLINLKERLSLLFKDKAELVIDSSDQGTTAVIRMPLLLSTPYEAGEG
jgi:two-component system sensor histidine kinase YesM